MFIIPFIRRSRHLQKYEIEENNYLTKMALRHAKCDPEGEFEEKPIYLYHIYKKDKLTPVWPDIQSGKLCVDLNDVLFEFNKINGHDEYEIYRHNAFIENNLKIKYTDIKKKIDDKLIRLEE